MMRAAAGTAKLSAWTAALLAASTGTALAQGDLEGRVVTTDSVKHAVSAARVQLPGAGRSATTDIDGKFAITDIPSGRQLVIVGKLGFRPESSFVRSEEHTS